jgi:tRNA1Val (adenine37-N6)-methyltransferase
MKVCTDACLFGAWVANKFEQKEIVANKILDIGCGTGLLSLMLAQKTTAPIDAIEIDAEAYLQATENISTSPFKDQIHTFHGPVEIFAAHNKYDFIICNPPFYENQLKSKEENRNIAMHGGLSFPNLAAVTKTNLSQNGKVAVLVPSDRVEILKQYFEAVNLFIELQINVKHSPKHTPFRSMLLFSFGSKETRQEVILIKTELDNYSDDFKALLNNYYLNF